jgi:Zn-dependent M28 family amino/carboxypeptidase
MARAAAMTQRHSRWIPEFWLREAVADSLLAAAGHDLGTLRAGEPQGLGDTIRATGLLKDVTVTPPNVVGILRGSDRSNEYVAVTAHFDHLGVVLPNAEGDSIANGADDNASGTAAVLELVEAMADLETPPDRSILFLLVSAEEYGLIGSAHFGSHPTVPMADVVANINLDMVGRNDPGQVMGIGETYSSLGAMADSLASLHETLGLTMIPDPVPEENLFFRSDQLIFACRDVPALFLHTGLHEDYHSVDDELERLDTDKVARVAGLAFYLTHAVAGAPGRPTWTPQGRTAINAACD